MTVDFEALIPANIRELRPYQPGKPIETLQRELGLRDIIKIASNENPMGPSPRALEAAHAALAAINAYPDADCYRLRGALAARHGIDARELVFGA
ncbi:MAG TPA: hypothetical protein VML75_02980, partial [Kofleriaceae bacterium]|nr:hypothetical protein [Kofleriaceae bacterium]